MRRLAALALAVAPCTAASASDGATVAARFATLTRTSRWIPAAAIRLPFRTFHPQGMVRVGENFFLSSVEVLERPQKFTAPQGGFDRSPGRGIGHLFKFGPDGRLLADLILGEGSAYHPGGIDYDGTSIWVPVSEYRPDSRAVIYRVDPVTMRARAAFRWNDHIGGIVRDVADGALIGLGWGSRRIYRWPWPGLGPAVLQPNAGQYVDYQDCHNAGPRRMLCGGVADYAAGATRFVLGGMELVDLTTGRPVWEVPVELRSATGRPMTQNPFWAEPTQTGMRLWFVPDDDDATLYAFDVATG